MTHTEQTSRFVAFRQLLHLLPDADPWRILGISDTWEIGDGSLIGQPGLLIGFKQGGRQIDLFIQALSATFLFARQFVDLVYLDLFPSSTRSLPEWENQFGLLPAGSDSQRRANVDAAWKAAGGQSPRYLQDVVQAAGFDVYIHEWWVSVGPPWVAKDPRTHTNVPLTGTVQAGEALAQDGEVSAIANAFLVNETDYIVNLDGGQDAPPIVPSDPDTWPYFLYWGAASFPARATIPASRRQEFEALILKLCPAQQWLVTLIDYV